MPDVWRDRDDIAASGRSNESASLLGTFEIGHTRFPLRLTQLGQRSGWSNTNKRFRHLFSIPGGF
jgi:hypothetical protein